MQQEYAENRESRLCKLHLCNHNIHSQGDFNRAAVALKKQLRAEGIIDFEKDDRYLKLLRCKTETYPDEEVCKYLENQGPEQPPVRQPTPRETHTAGPPQPSWYERTEDEFDRWYKQYQKEKNAPKPCPPGK